MDVALTNQLRLLAGEPPVRPARTPAGGGGDDDGDDDEVRQPAKPPADMRGMLRPYALLSALVGGVLGAILIGQWLDHIRGTSPAWTLGLALPVLAVSFYQLLRELRR